jgi:hypothetical protein
VETPSSSTLASAVCAPDHIDKLTREKDTACEVISNDCEDKKVELADRIQECKGLEEEAAEDALAGRTGIKY